MFIGLETKPGVSEKTMSMMSMQMRNRLIYNTLAILC